MVRTETNQTLLQVYNAATAKPFQGASVGLP